MIFVPPPFAADAILEAIDAEVELAVCITEGIPGQRTCSRCAACSTRRPRRASSDRTAPASSRPALARSASCPVTSTSPAASAWCRKSGTLTYEAVGQLTGLGIGQSTCIGIGGDPINGTDFIDALKLFNEDKDTDGVILIGEIGGNAEILAAEWIKDNFKKPVAGFIAGVTAPPGKRMGHAGAIISGGKGTAARRSLRWRPLA